ncbi:MAG: ABC transporter substrate-binding protein [Candidatus Magnetomorum sp.]|nr:ABC transporter substrate-binding protein [Candidatus Magnetomorum sp.]
MDNRFFLRKKDKTHILRCMIIGCFVCVLCACDNTQKPSDLRENYYSQSPEDVFIAIVDSSDFQSQFIEGCKLAINEINQLGVLGKTIHPLYYDDKGAIDTGKAIAKKLSQNSKVLAVIGHNNSDVAVSTSIIYEKNKLLFISPGTTVSDFIQNQNQYIFRNIPSNEQLTLKLIEYANRNALTNIAVVFDTDTITSQLANFFISEFRKRSGQIVATRSYISWETNFKHIIKEIKQVDCDALFISGNLPSAAIFIKQAREMDINQTILSTNALDSMTFFQLAGQKAKNVVLPTYFDPVQPLEETRSFVNNFIQKTGTSPDALAASGYDAILLLATTIEKSGSFVPEEIAATLHLFEDFRGATGKISMNMNGGITNKNLFIKKSTAEDFQFVERNFLGEVNPYECVKDFTLRIPIEESIPTIDPGLTDNVTSIDIVEQLFLGLTDYDPKNYEPVPELASSWTASPDYQQYTFYLRNDVFWTDGKPVTAYDIQWAILRNLNKETDSPYVYTLYILKNAKEYHEGLHVNPSTVGVTVIHNNCITFHLNKPAPYFPSMAGIWVFRPLPRHVIEKAPKTWTSLENIVSNGSYKLAAWEKGLMMILRKNTTYFDQKNVLIPEVRYLIVSDGRHGMEMYLSGEIDILGGNYLKIPLNFISDISLNPDYKEQYFQKDIFCSYAFAFNTQKFPVDNPLIRKAINASIDRKRLIQYILKGKQEVAKNFTPQLAQCGNNEIFDPVTAKKWLEQAGYPDGKGFPEIIIAYNESQTHELIARGVKDCLNYYLNINVSLKPLTWENYIDSLKSTRDWHLIRYGWCADYPDPNNWLNELFHPEKSENVTQWNNQEFIELMNSVDQTINFTDRIQLYCQAESILCEKACAVLPIYFERSHYLIHPRVKGWYHMPLGGQQIRNWSLKYF